MLHRWYGNSERQTVKYKTTVDWIVCIHFRLHLTGPDKSIPKQIALSLCIQRSLPLKRKRLWRQIKVIGHMPRRVLTQYRGVTLLTDGQTANRTPVITSLSVMFAYEYAVINELDVTQLPIYPPMFCYLAFWLLSIIHTHVYFPEWALDLRGSARPVA